MKHLVLLLTIFLMFGITSCCRYRGVSACWSEPVAVKKDLEKKDLKKEQR